MTTVKLALAGIAAPAIVGGCMVADKTPTGTAASAELNLSLVVVDRNGTITDTFERKVDAYIDLRPLDSAAAVTPADYAFQVVDPAGQLLSEDDITCRTFHVGARGFIDKVYSANGATCVHMFEEANDHLLPNLMPFGGSATRFAIHVAPLAGADGFAHPLAASFSIDEPTTPTCGDGTLDAGEQCDDGNQVDTDTCHNDCTPAVCGNGIVEADEQCDDGNRQNDDACRNNCTRRHED